MSFAGRRRKQCPRRVRRPRRRPRQTASLVRARRSEGSRRDSAHACRQSHVAQPLATGSSLRPHATNDGAAFVLPRLQVIEEGFSMFPDCPRFIADYWEQRPTVLRDPGLGLCDQHEVFQALQTARAMARAGRDTRPSRRSVPRGGAVAVDATPFLPDDTATSLSGSLRSARGIHREGVHIAREQLPAVLASAHVSDATVHARLVRPAWPAARRRWTSHLMVSRYGISPFAVHKDPNSVFTFLVTVGRR